MSTKTRLFLTGIVAVATIAAGSLAPISVEAATVAPEPAGHNVVVSGNPDDITPHVMNGETKAVVDLGSRVIVGGNFTTVKKWNEATTVTRNYLFAYDKATGNIDATFVPVLDGQVATMVASPDGNIFVGGQFKNLNGASAPFLVKMNPVTGQRIAAFTPGPTGMVYDIRLTDDALYLAGTFTKLRQTARTNFAAVNPTSGALLPINIGFTGAASGSTRVMRIATSPDGATMIAIGNFTSVGGQLRRNIAKIDLGAGGTGSVSSWDTSLYAYGPCYSGYDTYIRDVAFSPDGSYFVTVATGAYGNGLNGLCDAAARWETATVGVATPTWRNYAGGDSLSSVAVTGSAVYVAGHFRWSNNSNAADSKGAGAVDREGIAALDPESGVTLSWNPGRERGIASFRMTLTAEGLYVMSDSSGIGSEYHPRFSFLPVAGGSAPVLVNPVTAPVSFAYARSSVPNGQPDLLFARSLNGTTVGPEVTVSTPVTAWSQVRGVTVATDRTYRALANRTLTVSTDGTTFTNTNSWVGVGDSSAYAPGVSGGGRMFIATLGTSALSARHFSAESGLLSSFSVDASAGLSWSDVVGMTVYNGQLYHAHTNGTLRRTDLVNGLPVGNTTVTISGPAIDGINWSNTRALHAIPTPATGPTTTTTTAPTTTTTDPGPTTTTLPPGSTLVFQDDFTNGLAAWTGIAGLTVDGTSGAVAPPSIRAAVTGTRASAQRGFAGRDQVCVAESVKFDSLSANTNLMRIRTGTGGIARLYTTSAGWMFIRSDVSGTQLATNKRLVTGSWNRVEMCLTVGAAGSISLKLNGSAGPTLNTNTGTTLATVLEIGDVNANTWTGSIDDVVVTDLSEGSLPTTTTTAPTTTTTTAPPPTPTVLLSDGFADGLTGWTNPSGLTVDAANGAPAGTPPSLRVDAVGVRASAQRAFSARSQVCASEAIKIDSVSANTNLMRVRSTTTSIARVYVSTAGWLFIRSDAGGAQLATNLRVTFGTWNTVRVCVTTGASGTITLALNGTAASAALTANNGANLASVLEIGEANTNTWSASIDDVLVTDPTGA